MKNSDAKQSGGTRSNLPHQQFDIVTKSAIHAFPEDILNFLLRGSEVEFLEHLETEIPNVETRQMDSLIKVHLNGEPVLVHCELQTSDSTPLEMVRRNVGYLGRCYERYGLPLLSHVLYLRPDAGRNDPGCYLQEMPGYRFIVEYKVIRLIEVEGQRFLESRQPGMLPFCPLMKPPSDMDNLQWIETCSEIVQSLALESSVRQDLLFTMWLMSTLIAVPDTIAGFFPEVIVQDFPGYQYILEKGRAEGIEQGIEQGTKSGMIDSILLLLNTRFDSDRVAVLKPILESIDDLQRLKELVCEAAAAETLEAFAIHLALNGR